MSRSPRAPRSPRTRRTIRCAFAATLAVAAIVALATPGTARVVRPSGLSTETGSAGGPGTIVASGEARIRGVPDVLTMSLGVTSRGRTVGEALDRNNASAAGVMELLRDRGVDEKDIQTSNFSIGPVYDERSTEITGYQVSNVVTVSLRELGRAGALIDAAAEAGGDDVVVRGVAFDFDDTTALVAQARAEAVKRARDQAEQLAAAAGVELGAVRTISESSDDRSPVLDAAPEASRSQAADVSIEPGAEELSVRVSIVYSIRGT